MWLLLYGINAYWLTLVCSPAKQLAFHRSEIKEVAVGSRRGRSRTSATSLLLTEPPPNSWAGVSEHQLPTVTVQLPIFNERYVASRLLDTICCLDYPRDRFYIQVLDDSTDDTQDILMAAVAAYQRQGIWIDYIHRTNRTGFKAGALQAAMPRVQGDYIAIFDSDFMPSTDWLKRTITHYLRSGSDRIAVVQTRWGHVNSEYSLLTKLQSVGIDGHFAIEQASRSRNGYFLNFNGTGGIWNKHAIIDSGGWHADTLAEDMDLSYRAQLRGWQVVYDNDIVAEAELPVAMAAFKLQQFRWAKGSIQCAKKLLPAIWASKYSLATKWQATLHLTGYAVHPLMLLIIIFSIPLMVLVPPNLLFLKNLLGTYWWLFMAPATFGPPFLYFTAQRMLHPKTWHRHLGRILLLVLLGTGISFSNTRAVVAGLFNTGANFRRTPKFNIRNKRDRWDNKAYKIPFDVAAIIEICLCIYSCVAAVIAIMQGAYITFPFMLLYALGYGYVGGLTLWQSWQQSES